MGVRYLSPTGEVPELQVTQLREAVLHGGADYWTFDAGMATLSREEPELEEVLDIFGDEQAGFCLSFRSDRGRFASVSPDDSVSGVVTVYPGGEPLELQRQNFVPPELAWAAIEEFIRQPGLPTALKWDVDATF